MPLPVRCHTMIYVLLPQETVYLIPYVIAAAAIWILYILFRMFEMWYANRTDKVLYRDLVVFRTLSRKQKELLSKKNHFYAQLSGKEQRRFEHRVKVFLNETRFVGRENLVVTEEMKILVAGTAMMLAFGRKNYSYELVDHILLYPDVFYSRVNDAYHKGEFNPMQKTIVFSWKDFEQGYRITDDNLNVGIHEFMHAMQIGAIRSNDIDSLRLERVFQRILRRLTDQEIKAGLDKVKYFRAYAFTNQYEFMAVMVEYFFESAQDFKIHYPILYEHTRVLLNFENTWNK